MARKLYGRKRVSEKEEMAKGNAWRRMVNETYTHTLKHTKVSGKVLNQLEFDTMTNCMSLIWHMMNSVASVFPRRSAILVRFYPFQSHIYV